jgi:hypothetical protein
LLFCFQKNQLIEIRATKGKCIEKIEIEDDNHLRYILQEIRIYPDHSIFTNRVRFINLLRDFGDKLNSDDMSVMMKKSAFMGADGLFTSKTMETIMINSNPVAAYPFSRRLQTGINHTLAVMGKHFDIITTTPTHMFGNERMMTEILKLHPYKFGWAMEISR